MAETFRCPHAHQCYLSVVSTKYQNIARQGSRKFEKQSIPAALTQVDENDGSVESECTSERAVINPQTSW